MKSLTSKVLVFLVIAIGIYTAVWYTKARELESSLHTQIEKAAQDKAHGYLFQYESLERSGYPFDIILTLKNPKIKILASSAEIKLDGKIIDKFNPLGGLKSIEYMGKTSVTIPLGEGKEEKEFLLEGQIKVESESGSLLPSSIISHLATLANPLEQIWSHLNLTDGQVELNILKLTDVKANKVALDLNHATIHFAHKEISETNQTVLLNLVVKGFDAYPTLSYLYAQDANQNETTKLSEKFYEAFYSKMGKTNFNFVMDLNIPSNKQWQEIVNNAASYFLINHVPTSKITLKASSMGDNFGDSKFDFDFASSQNDAKEASLTLKANSETSPTKTYVDSLVYAVQEVAKAASNMKTENPADEKLKELFTKHSEDVEAIVPKMNEFGTIKFSHNLDTKINKENLRTKVKLSKFELLTALYGGRLHGEAEGDINTFSATFTLELIKYKPLIQDMIAYYNRLTRVINVFQKDEKSKLKEVSPQLVEKTLTYLREISNKPTSDSNDVEITMTSTPSSTRIGTLTFDSFTQKSMELMTAFEKELGLEKETKKAE